MRLTVARSVLGAIAIVVLLPMSVGAQMRMEGRNRTITEQYYESVPQTITYRTTVTVPYTVNQTCTRPVTVSTTCCCRSVYDPVRKTSTSQSYPCTQTQMQSYSCPQTYYRYEVQYRTYTQYVMVLRTRTRTEFEMYATPDTKALTDRADLDREIGRAKDALEADIVRMSAETQDLFNRSRLTEDFQVSSEALGEERFLEQFATASLARAVHVAR